MAATPTSVLDLLFRITVRLEAYLRAVWPGIATPRVVYAKLFHEMKNRLQLFRSHLQEGHLLIRNPQTSIPALNKGERSVVSLALELHTSGYWTTFVPTVCHPIRRVSD